MIPKKMVLGKTLFPGATHWRRDQWEALTNELTDGTGKDSEKGGNQDAVVEVYLSRGPLLFT